jgi:hypothetical protein
MNLAQDNILVKKNYYYTVFHYHVYNYSQNLVCVCVCVGGGVHTLLQNFLYPTIVFV